MSTVAWLSQAGTKFCPISLFNLGDLTFRKLLIVMHVHTSTRIEKFFLWKNDWNAAPSSTTTQEYSTIDLRFYIQERYFPLSRNPQRLFYSLSTSLLTWTTCTVAWPPHDPDCSLCFHPILTFCKHVLI